MAEFPNRRRHLHLGEYKRVRKERRAVVDPRCGWPAALRFDWGDFPNAKAHHQAGATLAMSPIVGVQDVAAVARAIVLAVG